MAVLIVVIRHKYNSVNPIMYENRNPCRSTDCSDSFCVHYKVNRDFQKKKKKIHVFNGSRTLTRLLRSVAWSSWWGFVMKLPVYRGKNDQATRPYPNFPLLFHWRYNKLCFLLLYFCKLTVPFSIQQYTARKRVNYI